MSLCVSVEGRYNRSKSKLNRQDLNVVTVKERGGVQTLALGLNDNERHCGKFYLMEATDLSE